MRKYFITGALVLVPLAITAWVLHFVIATLDQSLVLVPREWRPETYIPGLGAIITLAIVFLTGVLRERLVQRIPVVNSIYGSVKQVSDTLFSSSGNAFRKAVLIPYPHEHSYTIAFLTGVPGGDVQNHLVGEYVSVYVPTTPNPTSGFFLMMERSRVVELDMTVDTALKYIVSMGVVAPPPPAGTAIDARPVATAE
jgi:uncharacterized membrane protein